MLIGGSPIDWLPIIGIHLLFFSSITLSNSLKKVDWAYLKTSLPWILPAKIIGVIGLISLPPNIMTVIVYLITSLYALTWINNSQIISKKNWVNNLLLVFGGYLSGTSLMGGVASSCSLYAPYRYKKTKKYLICFMVFLSFNQDDSLCGSWSEYRLAFFFNANSCSCFRSFRWP